MRMPAVLTLQEAQAVVEKEYGLSVLHIEKLKGGNTSHLFLINTPNGKFVLKESSPEFNLEDILTEGRILQYLQERKMPVVAFIPTQKRELGLLRADRPVHLQPFIEGETVPKYTASAQLQLEAARLLGKLQTELFAQTVPGSRFDQGWFLSRQQPEHGLAKHEELIMQAKKLEDRALAEELIADLEYKKTQVYKAVQLEVGVKDFTYGVSHGDYNPSQFILRKGVIVGVLDFQRLARLPLVWEALRSYTLADPVCAEGIISIPNAKRYFAAYLEKNSQITRSDLAKVPYLSYLHIANNAHGYKEFLEGKLENPDSVLAYGRWYTKMLRWLEQNAAVLSEELAGLKNENKDMPEVEMIKR